MKKKERNVCGAKTRSGGRCQKSGLENGRCRLHGGKSLKGVDHPNFKTGRHSKYLPDSLSAMVEEMRLDEDLLDGSEEIRIMDARINQLIIRAGESDTPTFRKDLLGLRLEVMKAHARNDTAAVNRAFASILETIVKGGDEDENWHVIGRLFLDRDKLATSQHRRLVDASQMISSDRQMVLVNFIIDSIRSRVNNDSIVSAIIGDLRSVLASSSN